jgi:methyl-accepting chemotaxis protein
MADIAPYNRRLTDAADGHERLVRLESDVDHVKGSLDNISEKLQDHVEQNTKGFNELREHMTRLAMSAELQAATSRQQADSMSKLTNTVSDIAKSDFKIQALEDFRHRTEAHLKACDAKHDSTKEKLNKTTEKVDRLYWLAPLALLAIQGIWQLYTFFAR